LLKRKTSKSARADRQERKFDLPLPLAVTALFQSTSEKKDDMSANQEHMTEKAGSGKKGKTIYHYQKKKGEEKKRERGS